MPSGWHKCKPDLVLFALTSVLKAHIKCSDKVSRYLSLDSHTVKRTANLHGIMKWLDKKQPDHKQIKISKGFWPATREVSWYGVMGL